jgi:hypothetical protein
MEVLVRMAPCNIRKSLSFCLKEKS